MKDSRGAIGAGQALEWDAVLVSLMDTAHALGHRMESGLEQEAGLSWPRFEVLNELVRAGGLLCLSDVSERLSCVRSNVTQLVDRLEADGLVARMADPDDRRSVRAAITLRGRERHAAGALVLERIQREVSAKLTKVDREALQRALDALS
jgi:DNA-binding MarR family transcriptional regulator